MTIKEKKYKYKKYKYIEVRWRYSSGGKITSLLATAHVQS